MNTTGFDPMSIETVNMTVSYVAKAPASIAQGDMLALIALLIGSFLAILIINKLSGLILAGIKRIIVLLITGAALFHFSQQYGQLLRTEGFTANTILLGIVALVVGIASMVLGVYALVHHTKKHVSSFKEPEEKAVKSEFTPDVEITTDEHGKKGLKFKDLTSVTKLFSKQAIKNEKSLLSAITYLLIGQFGVFSSKTVAAPSVSTGLTIFVLFALGSFIFIRQSYEDYKQGLEHLGVVFSLGVVLSFVLGIFWAGHDASTLFSLQYFVTDCMVAVITGTAVALFAGSK